MIHFKFNDVDSRYLFLLCDDKQDIAACRSMMKSINLVDPICYLPSYKGPVFTNDYIWEFRQQSTGRILFYCSIGLWFFIYKYLKDNCLQFDGLDEARFKRPMKHTFEQFKEIVHGWHLKFEPRPYQYEVAYKTLCWNRSITQAATRAGKTLIAYLVFRYCIEHLGAKKILMIVPSIDLVKQGYADFNEYGEFFKSECVWAGGKLVHGSNLTIGTFQSLIKFLDPKSTKYNPSFYDDYDIVFCDEVHRATASQTKTIISQQFIKNCKIIFGMTGTLPKEGTSERFGVHSLLGAKINTITPKELQDEGFISKVHINQIRLNYINKEKQLDTWIRACEYVLSDYITETKQNAKGEFKRERKKLADPHFLFVHEKELPAEIRNNKYIILNNKEHTEEENKLEYKKYLERILTLSASGNKLMVEKMMVHCFPERLDWVFRYVLPSCDKNTLILAQHTSYIKYITKLIKERFPDRLVEVVTGAVTAKKREQIRLLMKSNNNVIIVASYACMSTGLTLANLCYGIFLESFKSNTINMQSIGRGLGLSTMKDEYILYDIIDCFDTKYASNKFKLQGLEKIKIYENEENQYPYTIRDIDVS